jgi:PAS domain S-box-containing protein
MARWSTSTVPASWCAPCGQPEYILWSKKDVTALKVLRDAKLVEARYDGILESMPDAILVANAAGRVVLANRQAEQLFGYARGALRGMVLEHLMPARFRRPHRTAAATRPAAGAADGQRPRPVRLAQRWRRVPGRDQPESGRHGGGHAGDERDPRHQRTQAFEQALQEKISNLQKPLRPKTNS